MKPRARAGLISRTVGEELVVYDPQTHVAHCLNRTAALVFQAADGRTSVAGLSAELQRLAQLEAPHDVVCSTLEMLVGAGLLEAPARPEEPSRRSAIRAVGVAALAPIVASLVVPAPAEAANTCIPQSSCTASNFGQPCYVLSQTECASKMCTGVANQCQ